jgi:hypothetical protein
MNEQHLSSRLAAASGAVFAVLLFAAAGDGSYSPVREVLATVALGLAIPFICRLGSLVRGSTTDVDGLAGAAIGAGVVGIALKLASGAPEVAIHEAGLRSGSTTYDAFTQMAEATTVISLVPLAVFCALTAVLALRTGVLPRLLAIGWGVTAVALLANSAFVGASFVPAILLFLLWCVVTSVHLVRAGSPRRIEAAAAAH